MLKQNIEGLVLFRMSFDYRIHFTSFRKGLANPVDSHYLVHMCTKKIKNEKKVSFRSRFFCTHMHKRKK